MFSVVFHSGEYVENMATIYIIDGDSSARKGLSKLLTVAGYTVQSFEQLDDFLQLNSTKQKACLIMDVWTSDLSGAQLESAFSDNGINIPILFLSARDDRASRKKAVDAKVSGFFRKPVDGPALLDAINWEIEKHSRKKIEKKG